MFYHIIWGLVGLIIRALLRLQVLGEDNVPHRGGLVVVSNHVSFIDPILIRITIGRPLFFMAKEELFKNRVAGFFLRYFGAFPISRGSGDRKALKQSLKLLDEGQAVLIFAEGTRSRSGVLRKALPGIALIATKSRAPVLPMAVMGTEQIQGFGGWTLRRPRVKVVFGKPIYLSQVQELDREELDKRTNLIMGHVASLLPREKQGYYEVKVD